MRCSSLSVHRAIRLSSVLLTVTVLANTASAATVPYSTDFSSNPGWTTGYTGTPTSSLPAATGGVWQVQLARGATGSTSELDSVQVTGLTTSGFYITADVTPIASTDTFNDSVGVRFLANTTTADVDSYVADFNIGSNNPGSGRMRLVKFTSSGNTIYPSTTVGNQGLIPNFSRTGSYHIEVTGTYNVSGALSIDYKVTDRNNAANFYDVTNLLIDGVVQAPDATPRTGSYFGVRSAIGGSGAASLAVNFDNFAVVPEPAMLVSASGLLGLLMRRRARR